jgi:hypothetical protein
MNIAEMCKHQIQLTPTAREQCAENRKMHARRTLTWQLNRLCYCSCAKKKIFVFSGSSVTMLKVVHPFIFTESKHGDT